MQEVTYATQKPTGKLRSSTLAASSTVDDLLPALEHPRKRDIIALRKVILGADPTIPEHIKWNAPSFRTTEYFATINLRAKAGVEVILHFGAKKNDISKTGVDMPDPSKLLSWLAKDRARVAFKNASDI